MNITYVKESHLGGDDKATVNVTTHDEVRQMISHELANVYYRLESLESDSRQLHSQHTDQTIQLKQELESKINHISSSLAEDSKQKFSKLERTLSSLEDKIESVEDGFELSQRELRGSLNYKLDNLFKQTFPADLAKTIEPHFSHLALQIQNLQEMERRLQAMQQAIRQELDDAQSIADALCHHLKSKLE